VSEWFDYPIKKAYELWSNNKKGGINVFDYRLTQSDRGRVACNYFVGTCTIRIKN